MPASARGQESDKERHGPGQSINWLCFGQAEGNRARGQICSLRSEPTSRRIPGSRCDPEQNFVRTT